MNRQSGAFIGLAAVVSFLLGLVVAGTRPPTALQSLPARAVAEVPALKLSADPLSVVEPAVGAFAVDFAAVTAKINAAVVNVDTASRNSNSRMRFSRALPGEEGGGAREGSGSGFIIDPSGFILTNNHVVTLPDRVTIADRVTVTLSDGRVLRADVVGVDPAIDVALLRVHVGDPLPVAPLGDSEALRVGEWVCAIGNPLGVYVHSVTVGVVSFLGRKIFDKGLDAFIQTDAAITFGNSGGPLINAHGQVVGIATLMSGQNPNIGFAIPIAQVVGVLPQLREHGSVARGYMGIALTDVTPALRLALHIAPLHGALVEDVPQNTPAEQAGLRSYDVVVAADGQPILSDDELVRHVSAKLPGTLAALTVWREGGTRLVSIKLRDRPLDDGMRRGATASDVRPAVQLQSPLGIEVRELDASTAERLGVPDTVQGVLVRDVDPAGPARVTQVRINHVILEINRHRVTSLAQYRAVIAGLKPGEAAALLIFDRTNGGQRFICTVTIDSES